MCGFVCGFVWHAGLRKLAAAGSAQVEAAAIANAAWLEDVVMHLLCVLALDRFADYVSDQVGGTQQSTWLACHIMPASNKHLKVAF